MNDDPGISGPSFDASAQLPEPALDITFDWEEKARLPASAGLVRELLQRHDEKLTAIFEDGFKQIQVLIENKAPGAGPAVVNLQSLGPVKKKKRIRASTASGASRRSGMSKSDDSDGSAASHQAIDVLGKVGRTSLVNLESFEEAPHTCWSVDSWCPCVPSEENPPNNRVSRLARKLVDAYSFETFFAGVIMTNSLFIAIQVEYSASQPGGPPNFGLFIVSSVYSLLFTVELLLRLAAAGPRLFCGQDWAWALLDTIVVVTSVFEFIVELPYQRAEGQPDDQSLFGNMRLLRILRIAKITRAVRIIRLVKFIRALRSLLFCIGKTLRAMAWSAALLVLIIFLFGLVFTDIATEYFANPDQQWNPVTTDFLKLRFSSLEGSMHTLFASITGGFTWVEARDAFAEISFVWGIMFQFFISFCLFAVLNVMTGVFCQSAIESAEKDHELNLQMLAHERAKYFRAVRRLFQQLDQNADGGITVKEFEVALQEPTLIQVFDALEISADDAWALFTQLDSDGDAHVDAEEFLEGCMLLKGPARSIDVMGIKRDLAVVKQRRPLLEKAVPGRQGGIECQRWKVFHWIFVRAVDDDYVTGLGIWRRRLLKYQVGLQLRDEKLFQRLEEWLSRMEAIVDNALTLAARQAKPLSPRSFCSSGEEPSLADAPITKVKRKTRVDRDEERRSQQGVESPSANVVASILEDELQEQEKPKLGVSRTKAFEVQESEGLRQQVGSCLQSILHTHLDKEDEKLSWPRRTLARIVKSWLFEAIFAIVILSNSVFIAIQVEATSQNPGIDQDLGFFIAGSVYTFLFTLELLLRIAVHGITVFIGPDWAWLFLDLLVVSSSIFEFVLEMALQQQEDSASVLTNMRLLRILRIGRITRAIRIVRLVKFIRSLRQLLYSIGQTLRAMAWSVVLLGLIIFLFGLIFTDICSEYMTREPSEITQRYVGFIEDRFGGLESSMHTLYASITGGLTWIEARDALAEISTLWGLLFEAYIAFCTFAVLNVMTGVFCQSAMESAEKDHELVLQNVVQEKAKYFRAVRRLFAQLDQNGDGGITAKEFEVALQDPALMHVFDALEISADDAWNLFTQLDSDGDAHVDAEEFLEGCMLLKGPARSIDVMGIKRDVAVVKHRLQQVFATLRYST
ncbi:Cacna1f [Symbiodinium pilosum]|uniref:Cacna1f protein n=1 Tax=Symbiodinium pilosum TaxID=2952 RepID=A0A812WEN5_SYMPI|nr:Cacna1f [Symbiodinium pilosum]